MARKNKKQRFGLLSAVLGTLALGAFTIFLVHQISKPQLQKSEASSSEEITNEEDLKPEGVIVKYKNSSQLQTKAAKLKRYSSSAEDSPREISTRTYAVKTNPEDVDRTIEDIKNEEGQEIEYVEPDYQRQLYFTPNDPLFKDEWWLKKVEAEKAWDLSKGSPNVVVALIDTGVSLHPDLAANVIGRYNFVGGGLDDVLGHGTEIAGIVSAVTNNNLGIASIGYNVKIISLKVVAKKTGGASDSDIIKAINTAVEKKADIINMSLGGGKEGQALKEAIDYAWSKGVFIVASAGNTKSSKPTYPASYDHVFSVAATSEDDSKASFSTYGGWVDIAAPGVNILSTNNSGSYESHSGTSPAAPIVAGVAALIKSKFPSYTNAQIEKRLCDTADKIDKTGQYWKCGRVNAFKALYGTTNETPSPTNNPQPTQTPAPTLPPNPDKTLSFRIRFQGITQKAGDQKIKVQFYKDSNLILEKENQKVSNDENGIYTFYLDNSDNKIVPGKYTIRIKGESHLGKKYDIEIKGNNDAIDLSKSEAKAGDVNQDNQLTITDIAQVLSFYVTFSTNVDPNNPKMIASDINKDGKITIIDVALVAINWSSFTINGE